MNRPTTFRYRLHFGKTLTLRFTGHLDLHRAWERTFRRAGLPLAYTQGYNPRARINIGLALPLGCTSAGDLMDLTLEQELPERELLDRVQASLPPGLLLEQVRRVSPDSPKLQQRIQACEYQVPLPSEVDLVEVQERVAAALAAPELPRSRGEKRYDLRPLIEQLEMVGGSAGEPPALRMRLKALPGETGRPDQVLLALALDPAAHVPHRSEIVLKPEA